MPNFRVTAIYGNNRIEVQDEQRNKSIRRSAYTKKCEPRDNFHQQLPPIDMFEQCSPKMFQFIYYCTPSRTCIMVSTSGATLKVSIPNTSQEDNPPLEDISPLVAPHLILLPMLTSISNSLLAVTRTQYVFPGSCSCCFSPPCHPCLHCCALISPWDDILPSYPIQ